MCRLYCIARRKKRRVRSAEAERHAEALRVADGDVRAEFSRRLQQRQRQKIRGDDDQRAGVVRLLNEFSVIENRAVGGGILHQRAENSLVEFELRDDRQPRLRCRAASRAFARPRSFADGNCSRRRKSLPFRLQRRGTSVIASAAAVASSSSDALAISIAVRSVIIVWKFSSASSRPCAISA